jgi:cell shape-determining protein MreC
MGQHNLLPTLERHTRLTRCYVQLVKQFTQRDLDYVELKSKFAALLTLLKKSQHQTIQARAEKEEFAHRLATVEAKYQRLRRFEPLLDEIEAQQDSPRLKHHKN